jgi:hypothetical protein
MLLMGIMLLVALGICGLCALTTNATSNQTSTDAVQTTPTIAGSHKSVIMTQHSPTVTQLIATPTPQATHYPPTTVADLHSLAAKGDANPLHEFHSESVGLTGVCPQPKREVTVDSHITGQQLAEDLLAYFYAQRMDSPCGSVIFAYHTQSEANDTYTVGRIIVDVIDATGQVNTDPNASGITHKLTLDIGGLGENKEYVVTY